MRIISQNGAIDVPYETSILHIVTSTKAEYSKSFIFYTPNNSMDSNELARYSTEKKAQKAMEMLRDAYSNYDFCINLTTENMLKSYARSRPKEEFMKYAYPYFQFPKDEDVEV